MTLIEAAAELKARREGRYLEPETMISKATVWLDANRNAVADGDKSARSLLVRAGGEIPQATAEKYPGAVEMIGGVKLVPVAPDPVDNLETREPNLSTREPRKNR